MEGSLAKVDATLARRGDLVLETTLAGKTMLQRRNLPMAEFETGNLIALSMLYHFRAKFARGEHRYSWQY